MSRGCIKKLLVETVTYIFTDIPFLDTHNPCFFKKNDLKLLKEKALEMIPKYWRTEAHNWPSGSEKIKNIVSHFN